MLALAAIGALTCAEAAVHRDSAAALFLAAAAAQGAGPELVQALGVDLPDPDGLIAEVRALDARLARCPDVAIASRPGPGSPWRRAPASAR